jgi:hypothetical protein
MRSKYEATALSFRFCQQRVFVCILRNVRAAGCAVETTGQDAMGSQILHGFYPLYESYAQILAFLIQ